MRRTTGFSTYFSLLKATSASTLVLAAVLSCSDNTAPKVTGALDPNSAIVVFVPDSVKQAQLAWMAANSPVAFSNSPSNLVADASPRLLAVSAAPMYVMSEVEFHPEADAINVLPKLADDGVFPDIPIGFDFSFYGNTYSKLNLYYNGFVGFGQAVNSAFYAADLIPYAGNPNNMIALSWNDWRSDRAPNSIRYETRGDAPHRKFIIQFIGVPEYSGTGSLTSQLVLSEGSNDITIYTASMSVTNSGHRVTQGIENAAGSEAAFDSVQNPVNKIWSPRVRGFFNLSNDAVRFSLAHVNQPPVVTPPANLTVSTDPGVCLAAAQPGVATVTDDADGSSVAGVRSDALALDAAYPKGVTTIVWTATDAAGLTATGNQTVTVNDTQKPSITAPDAISTRADHGVSTATVSTGTATANDNCSSVTVSSARSDGAPLSAAFPIGVTTITWTATDESGNAASATQTITVTGNAPPVITAPDNIAANTDPGVCLATVNPGSASATDDTEGTVVDGTRSDGLDLSAGYPKGSTTITWKATDVDGLTATATQIINVSDKERPWVGAPANKSANSDPGRATATVDVGSAGASDNCHGVGVGGKRSDGAAVSDPYPIGITTVTWTATDAAGNISAARQLITVVDNTAPTISGVVNLVVNATMPSGAVVTFAPVASDNVGVSSVSCSPASGSVFPIGQTSSTCTATDAAGNQSSTTFTITVRGAHEQIGITINELTAMNLPNGVANPLLAALRTAYDPGSSDSHVACVKLNDFLTGLQRNKASAMSSMETLTLLADVRRIMAVIGC
jgi:hypothetical protein